MDIEIKFSESAFKHGVNEADIRWAFKTIKYDAILEEEEIMPDMTEEEYDELDELWTKTNPKIGPNGTGFISRRNARLFGLDDLSMDYLMTKSMADNKTPADIIGEMIRERIIATV